MPSNVAWTQQVGDCINYATMLFLCMSVYIVYIIWKKDFLLYPPNNFFLFFLYVWHCRQHIQITAWHGFFASTWFTVSPFVSVDVSVVYCASFTVSQYPLLSILVTRAWARLFVYKYRELSNVACRQFCIKPMHKKDCEKMLTRHNKLCYDYSRRQNHRRNTMQMQILNIIQIVFPVVFLFGLCAAIVKK